MPVAIKAENISKAYRLGLIGTGTLASDLKRWYALARGKEDPFLKIGEVNDRSVKGESDVVWSLKDINFEIEQGEAIGIIGKNGAGKSTLLKILSRVTGPTTGKITGNGRVASLLEVGTGFHPELTGEDNIYLNGAILGMRKKEIKRKFDEIVNFSGVERYIDTPVKRYSSGMYVRLAFAVAAYLESEILIVDEVLAVGDVEFQKKCLGKMSEVSKGEGKTVLFVSHNMNAVKSICKSIIHLENGQLIDQGPSDAVIGKYLVNNQTGQTMIQSFSKFEEAPGNENVRVKRMEICPILNEKNAPITVATPINIEFEFWNNITDKKINLSLHLYTITDECVFAVTTEARIIDKGLFKAICKIPQNLLNDGIYQVSMLIVGDSEGLFFYENKVRFEVHENRQATSWYGKWPGLVRPNLNFEFEKF